jgi:ribosomal protein S18 acetylase RimI-like enzyme
MAVSSYCFGYVAVDGDEVIGVVTGTTDSGAVFKELVLRRGYKLALPVLGSLLRHPSLIPKVVQTMLYPSQTHIEPGEAEMLYLATRSERRGEGIGRALWWAFADGLRERGYKRMGLCVDVANAHAVRFHERQGMDLIRTFTMYGREFRWYVLPLE